MECLVSILIVTGLIGLAIAVWTAPRMKRDLAEQGLRNTVINILAWRPF